MAVPWPRSATSLEIALTKSPRGTAPRSFSIPWTLTLTVSFSWSRGPTTRTYGIFISAGANPGVQAFIAGVEFGFSQIVCPKIGLHPLGVVGGFVADREDSDLFGESHAGSAGIVFDQEAGMNLSMDPNALGGS